MSTANRYLRTETFCSIVVGDTSQKGVKNWGQLQHPPLLSNLPHFLKQQLQSLGLPVINPLRRHLATVLWQSSTQHITACNMTGFGDCGWVWLIVVDCGGLWWIVVDCG